MARVGERDDGFSTSARARKDHSMTHLGLHRWTGLLLLVGCQVTLEPDFTPEIDGSRAQDTETSDPADARPVYDAMADARDGLADDKCLNVSPSAIDFGIVTPGQIARAEVIVGHCSGDPITLKQPRLIGASEGLAIVEAPGQRWPATLAASDQLTILLELHPTITGRAYSATLIIRSGRGGPETVREIPVTGRGAWTPAACAPWNVQIAPAHDPRRLTETQSVKLLALPPADIEREGAIVEWTLLERPPTSIARLSERSHDTAPEGDDSSTDWAWLTLDAGGIYRASARVQMPAEAGCPPVTKGLDLFARSLTADLYVRLVWSPPMADVAPIGLHLLHFQGDAWNIAPLDCHAQNPAPDWGAPGQSADDPQLVGDPGTPEWTAATSAHLVLAQVEPDAQRGGAYRIAVGWAHLADTPVTAQLEIFARGYPRWSGTRTLSGSHGLWDAAAMGWRDGRDVVVPLDRLFVGDAAPAPDTPLPAQSACAVGVGPRCMLPYRCVMPDAADTGRCRY